MSEATAPGTFIVHLLRSDLRAKVGIGDTILEVARAAGLEVPHSCMRGTCGICEAKVLDGVPDHRDRVLSPAERAAGRTMMICCSRSRTPVLVLDL